MKKLLTGAAIAAAVVLGTAGPAFAEAYAPVPAETTQTVAPGGTVTLTTAGWTPGESITITYPDSFTLAAEETREAAEDGTLAFDVVVGTEPGEYEVIVAGESGEVVYDFTVEAEATPAPSEEPTEEAVADGDTAGADATPWIWGGVGVVAAAAIATGIGVAVRRRNQA